MNGKSTPQEGSLLVMSVVLLGVIAFTAIFMSLTLIYEIKSTRFSDNAGVSYYATESGAEDSLFRLSRSKASSGPKFFNDKAGVALCAAEHGVVSGGTAPTEDACLDGSPTPKGDPERIFDYAMLGTAAEDFTATDIAAFDTVFADIFDPLLEETTGETGITQLNIDWYLSSCATNDLRVIYTPINILTMAPGQTQPQLPESPDHTCNCTGAGPDGLKCQTITIGSLSPANFYRISFTPQNTSVAKIVMTTNAPGVPSEVQIKVTGSYRETQSTINLRGVWQNASAGIFESVFFSEESLIKIPGQEIIQTTSLCGFCSNSDPQTPILKRCSSSDDCDNGYTCSILNTATDTQDENTTQAECYDTGAGETYSLGSITQTPAGTCNARCTVEVPILTYSGTPTAGGFVDISWDHIYPASTADWIAVYEISNTDNGAYMDPGWAYIPNGNNCVNTSTSNSSHSGTCTNFLMPSTPPAGEYHFRLFLADGYDSFATSSSFFLPPP